MGANSETKTFFQALYKNVQSMLGYEDLKVVDPTSSGDSSTTEKPSEERKALFSMLSEHIGADVSSLVSLPVWLFEPTTNLMKMSENMEYHELLDKAADEEDEIRRLAWIAAWGVTPYAANERTYKPFNPILGETYEFHKDEKNLFYIAEQVSHHPPVAACYGENDKWTYTLTSAPTAKFMGNHVDINPFGRTRIAFKSDEEPASTYMLTPPMSRVHNIILGGMWIDSHGELIITSSKTGCKALVNFEPCGWFGKGRYQIKGYVYDKEGTKKLLISGSWNHSVSVTECDEKGEPVPNAASTVHWTSKPLPKGDKFGLTEHARQMISEIDSRVLPSDSRLRPDRLALLKEEYSSSQTLKHQLEEKQRKERKMRKEKGMEWKPRYFDLGPEIDSMRVYDYNGAFNSRAELLRVDGGKQLAQSSDFCPWQFGDEN